MGRRDQPGEVLGAGGTGRGAWRYYSAELAKMQAKVLLDDIAGRHEWAEGGLRRRRQVALRALLLRMLQRSCMH